MSETWWRAKANSYAERVRSGEFGTVKAEWQDGDGWDAVSFSHFAVKTLGGRIVHLHVNESGIWAPCRGGGYVNVSVSALREGGLHEASTR